MAEQIIQCPHCQAELSISDEFFGIELECPTCQNHFIFNAPEVPATPPPPPPRLTPPPPQQNQDLRRLGNLGGRLNLKRNAPPSAPAGEPEENNDTPAYSVPIVNERKIIRKFFCR